MILNGEIDVERFMEFSKRQRGMTEWVALKEYWRACRQGEEAKARVLELYGDVLFKGLEKYRKRYIRDKVRG